MRPVSARERRLVALLIFAVLVAGFYFLLVAPIANGFAARAAARERLALRYVHNLRTIAAIPRLRRQAEQQRGTLDRFVADADSVEAGREWLKARLQRAVDRTGGEFRQGDDAEGRPGWARARAAARMTLPQLVALLGGLQNEPPWLVVETLGVTGADTPIPNPSAPMDIEIEASIPLRPAAAR